MNFKKIIVLLVMLLTVSLVFTACTDLGPSLSDDGTTLNDSTGTVGSETATEGTPEGTEGDGETQTQANPIVSLLTTLAFPAILLVAFYFFLIRPQKKKDKESKEMRDSITVGDEIVTIGGIVGRVVMVKDEDQLVIETGSDKSKMRIMRWAVSSKLNVAE